MKTSTTFNQNNMQELIVNAIIPCLNDDMVITEDAVMNILIDCKVKEPFAGAVRKVTDWFNSKNVITKDEEEQGRYVGALVNLLTLLAEGDVSTLLDNWVLSDMD